MQVRYQTAPRSDTIVVIEDEPTRLGTGRVGGPMIRPFERSAAASAAQDFHHIFKLDPHLLDDLLALRDVRARLLAGELVARPADGEALVVEQAPDLADDDHVLALVVAPVAAALDGLQLGEFLLPVAQHVRLHAAQLTLLSDGEGALAGNRRQLRV